MRLLGGYFVFDSPDAELLVSLLPALVHMRGADRLTTLTRLLGEEARERRPGRDLVLSRLVEVLLIEALRTLQGDDTPPGLLRGLADTRVSAAIRRMHGDPARSWTVVELAREAALSRSAFFDRFMRIVGVPPMEYLLAWRMAVAKDLLRRHDGTLSEVAERVGTVRRAPLAPRSADSGSSTKWLRARACQLGAAECPQPTLGSTLKGGKGSRIPESVQ